MRLELPVPKRVNNATERPQDQVSPYPEVRVYKIEAVLDVRWDPGMLTRPEPDLNLVR